MKNKKTVFTIILATLLFATLSAYDPFEEEDGLIVPLATGTKMVPIYLVPLKNSHPGLNEDYIHQLERILRFDLENNGMTEVVARDSTFDPLIARKNYTSKQWKEKGVEYIVSVELNEEGIKPLVASVIGEWTKDSSPYPLNGNLNHDRKEMHAIADSIHKVLFGKEGIARSKVLYTIRNRIPGKKEWTSEVWEADYDGGNPRPIITNLGYCVTPQYAPPAPGKHPGSLLFVSYQNGQPKIYIGSLKNGEASRLSYLGGNQLMPTLSFQRNQVAFISDRPGNPDLFIQGFDPEKGAVGKPRQIFAAPLASQGTPTFSPDGKKVAFVSNKDGSPRVYMIKVPPIGARLKDIKPELITKFRRGCTAPAWSPDGKKIAYCARMKGVRQIFVYDLQTKKEIQLTKGRDNAENPTWAPNSLHLIYNTSKEPVSDLYLINLRNPKSVKITSGKGEKRFPHFEPRV